jgi:DNA-directed RNA polymerase specialized sigma subunit
MVLTKSEKLERERAITELLKQDKPVSEIAHDLHVSFTDISRVKKKYEEELRK